MNTKEITIEQKEHPFSLNQKLVIFRGDKETVLKASKEHCEENYWGYGSNISEKKELQDGSYEVVVSEFKSCE